MGQKGTLYVIPSILGEKTMETIPGYVKDIIHDLNTFVVENIRTARRFIRDTGYPHSLDDLKFFELHKRTEPHDVAQFLEPIKQGISIGLLSEAGAPGIADPGAMLVELAHQNNIEVKPLVGPSSILLALMASGFNGQQFSFHGYLPIQEPARSQKIKELEQQSKSTGETGLFIETPYRNNEMIKALLETCKDSTRLCIASNLTLPNEKVKTLTVSDWKKNKPDLHKQPAVFLISAENTRSRRL